MKFHNSSINRGPENVGAASTIWIFFRYYLFALIFALSLASLVPPMSAPDEISHVARAGLLVNGQWLLKNQSVENSLDDAQRRELSQSGGDIDSGLKNYIHSFRRFILDPNSRPSQQDRASFESLQWTGKATFEPTPGTGYYFPAIYLPHALGLALGRHLNLSIHYSYHLSRAFVIAAGLAISTFVLFFMRPSLSQFALMLLPMGIFQSLSPVVDGLTNALALFIIVFTYLSWRRHSLNARWYLVAYFSAIFVLLTTRLHLFPIIFLPLLLALRLRRTSILIATLFVAACALLWLRYSILSTVDHRIVRSLGTIELFTYYLNYPAKFISVFFGTLTAEGQILFYWRSFVGILGWLESPLLRPFYLVLGIALVVLIFLDIGPGIAKDRVLRITLLLSAFASFFLIFLAMLVSWTPHPAVRIEGIQGRYFLVPAMFIVAAISDWEHDSYFDPDFRFRNFVFTVFLTSSLLGLVQTVLNRYH